MIAVSAMAATTSAGRSKQEVHKRLAYQVAYTYSKSIDEGFVGWFGGEGHLLTDRNNVKGIAAHPGLDLRHTLSVNMLYQVPFGHGQRYSTKNGVLDTSSGNWQINNIFTARSGVPFNVFYGAATLRTPAMFLGRNMTAPISSAIRPKDRVLMAVVSEASAAFFNTSAFAVPAQYTFGNSGRDAFRSPKFWNLDTSIFRQFRSGRRPAH